MPIRLIGTKEPTGPAPAGLAVTAMSGIGWTCGVLPTCTRSDLLAAGASYPPITVTVTVAANATSLLLNSVAVSTSTGESDTGNNWATDSTVILLPPDLTISKAYSGNFSQGQTGATYAVTVTNSGAGEKLAGALVSLTDTAPSGLTITAMSGTGWTCTASPTCTRSDMLAAGANYGPITVTVAVATNASSPQVSSATVATAQFEGNTGNNSVNDSTVILVPPDLTVVASHVGNFSQGQTGATYTATVSNLGAGDKLGGESDGLLTHLLDILPLLDVDGNGKVDAITDGRMIMRKLLGQSGAAITQGALGLGATRNTAEIEAYIQTLKPP